jgi:hypothetical protein
MRAVSTDVGDRLRIIDYREGWAGYHVLVVCAACARSQQGKRGLQRCWHEEQEGDTWSRCDQVARGTDFCVEHAKRRARYRREAGQQSRRAQANVPYLWSDGDRVMTMGRVARELLPLERQVRDVKSGQATVKQLQKHLFEAATRLADDAPQDCIDVTDPVRPTSTPCGQRARAARPAGR